MAKPNDNFLRGWCRQLRAALDEGGELGYEAAELIEEALDLFVPGDGDPESPVVDDESTPSEESDGDTRGVPSGRIRQDAGPHPRVRGVAGQVDLVSPRGPGVPRVPRGTGGGAAVLTSVERQRVLPCIPGDE